MCAGKKECVTVKVNDKKEIFKKLNSSVKTGFLKFCEKQPKQVVNVNSSCRHKVCVCKHHQNVKLLTISLPLKSDNKDILKKVVCNINSRNCMMHVCENYPGLDGARNFTINCFNENNNDTDNVIT